MNVVIIYNRGQEMEKLSASEKDLLRRGLAALHEMLQEELHEQEVETPVEDLARHVARIEEIMSDIEDVEALQDKMSKKGTYDDTND